MRIVIALGGNALLKRGEPMTADVQRRNIRIAAEAMAPVAAGAPAGHQPRQRSAGGTARACKARPTTPDEAYPLDVLGAETEGMIGYMIEQELGNLLPFEVPFATAADDGRGRRQRSRLQGPDQVRGARLRRGRKPQRIKADKGWTFKLDGAKWRRVVPSPLPKRIFEIRPIRWLLDHGTVVICAGGGGIPTMYAPDADRKLVGVEAVIDKDLCSELLARELDADLLRHGDRRRGGVRRLGYAGSEGHPQGQSGGHPRSTSSRPARWGRRSTLPAASPKATGHTAAIGALADIEAIVRGEKGTIIGKDFEGLTWH